MKAKNQGQAQMGVFDELDITEAANNADQN
jgi:hypothetical protein